MASSTGQVFTHGSGRCGKLASGDDQDVYQPTLVTILGHIKVASVAAGDQHSVFLTPNGVVITVGGGTHGSLGNGELNDVYSPCIVNGLQGTRIVEVAAAGYNTMARTKDGTLYTWGENNDSSLGLGLPIDFVYDSNDGPDETEIRIRKYFARPGIAESCASRPDTSPLGAREPQHARLTTTRRQPAYIDTFSTTAVYLTNVD
jgi:alpha-tubulin suppressor-like RCC1 family protein